MELVHMEYLAIEGKDKDVSILVVTDHFTRFSQAFVKPNQLAATTDKDPVGALLCVLWNP